MVAVNIKTVVSRDVTSCCVVDGTCSTHALRHILEEI